MPKLACSISAGLIILQACANVDRTIDRNVRFFDELAFGGPYDNDLTHAKTLVKWDGPIRVTLIGKGAAKFESEVMRHLNRVSKLTGLSIELEKSPTSESNYVVQFSPDIGFSVRKDFVRCSVGVRPKDGVIKNVRIKISTANESEVAGCITHEIMHSLGFRYHSGLVRSVLSPVHGEDDFTHWDDFLLTTLYSDTLSPGMSRAETRNLARSLIGKALSE